MDNSQFRYKYLYLYDINFRDTILFDFKSRRIFKSTCTLHFNKFNVICCYKKIILESLRNTIRYY